MCGKIERCGGIFGFFKVFEILDFLFIFRVLGIVNRGEVVEI